MIKSLIQMYGRETLSRVSVELSSGKDLVALAEQYGIPVDVVESVKKYTESRMSPEKTVKRKVVYVNPNRKPKPVEKPVKQSKPKPEGTMAQLLRDAGL